MSLVMVYQIISSVPPLSLVLDRINNQGMITEISSEGARNIRWLRFIEFTCSNMHRFFFGSSKIFYVFGNNVYRDPHNYFIRMFYLNGIIVVFLYWAKFIKFYIFMIRKNTYSLFLVMLIAKMISMMIISESAFMKLFIIFSLIIIYKEKEVTNVQK